MNTSYLQTIRCRWATCVRSQTEILEYAAWQTEFRTWKTCYISIPTLQKRWLSVNTGLAVLTPCRQTNLEFMCHIHSLWIYLGKLRTKCQVKPVLISLQNLYNGFCPCIRYIISFRFYGAILNFFYSQIQLVMKNHTKSFCIWFNYLWSFTVVIYYQSGLY